MLCGRLRENLLDFHTATRGEQGSGKVGVLIRDRLPALFRRPGPAPVRAAGCRIRHGCETRSALAVAMAWGYVTAEQSRPPFAALDRVIAMLWRLLHMR
jgi:hypothetical protein